jgi:predicted DNA-binding transcriptional regulator AlpA
MSGRLIRRELALEKIGICASTFHKLIREGVLPEGTSLTPSGGIVGWYEDVIDAYVEQCRYFPCRRGDPRKRNIQTIRWRYLKRPGR